MPPERAIDLPAGTVPVIRPGWAAPAGVGAAMSGRAGGVSTGPWSTLNLGDHVGDDPQAVAENRRRFAQTIGARPLWLSQVHGAVVVDAAAHRDGPAPVADGVFAAVPGVACTVLVADCLPVLLAARNGRAVGAAHAGWRGLAGGVVEATARAVARAAGCEPAGLVAWLGPCIGPTAFEVGEDVVQAFGAAPGRFVPDGVRDGRPRWRADLAGLARDRLRQLGVAQVDGGLACTVGAASEFFSFRRDGVTGRMAASVWLQS